MGNHISFIMSFINFCYPIYFNNKGVGDLSELWQTGTHSYMSSYMNTPSLKSNLHLPGVSLIEISGANFSIDVQEFILLLFYHPEKLHHCGTFNGKWQLQQNTALSSAAPFKC